MKRFVKSNNMELQFWGYEGGNILASVAGAGGFLLFYQSIFSIVSDSELSQLAKLTLLFKQHADVTVTVGIVCLVLIAPPTRSLLRRFAVNGYLDLFDVTVVGLASLLLLYAINSDSGWISIASASFVVASSLLRHCHKNPFLLKAGGGALLFGGVSLALFGFSQTQAVFDHAVVITGVLTIFTGFYVSGAGLLTYKGGIYQTNTFEDRWSDQENNSLTSFLLHPIHGYISVAFTRYVDPGVQTVCEYVVGPSIFWIKNDIQLNKPFLTSMWARMPWRIVTAVAALLSFSPVGVAFALANLGWLIGDIAIGSEDWELSDKKYSGRTDPREYYSMENYKYIFRCCDSFGIVEPCAKTPESTGRFSKRMKKKRSRFSRSFFSHG